NRSLNACLSSSFNIFISFRFKYNLQNNVLINNYLRTKWVTLLVFNPFKITLKIRDLILERSINNQIENAYNSIKANSIENVTSIPLFYPTYGYGTLEYDLDDFTRFPTVKETIVEVVNNVWVSNKKGSYEFHIREEENAIETENFLPLVLVDGILIQNHNEVIDFSAKKIKKISVFRDKYIYGSKIFGGILSIKTINGNNIFSKDYLHKIKLFKPENRKSYFKQEYDGSNTFNRIPDYRNQLLWLPNFKLDKKEKTIEFYTSDYNGDYEICLEGFTNEGNPISLKEIITVK
ncbi:MAG: hypothetical protein L3J20_14070, partial [Flavobacteriaceae bacterium]|nr:hypothetical protein [Flavobacteriaceae bacterium]